MKYFIIFLSKTQTPNHLFLSVIVHSSPLTAFRVQNMKCYYPSKHRHYLLYNLDGNIIQTLFLFQTIQDASNNHQYCLNDRTLQMDSKEVIWTIEAFCSCLDERLYIKPT